MIYDGDQKLRDFLFEHYEVSYNTPLICPTCLNLKTKELQQNKETIKSLMESNVFLSKLLSKDSEKNSFVKKIEIVPPPEFVAEVWVDNKLIKIYRGQDALDVETGKIKIPKGAIIKTWDY
jgi:hypothetical protein